MTTINATPPDLPPEPARQAVVAPRCVSIDLEVGVKDHRIHQFAAVRGDTDATLVYRNGDLQAALAKLDLLAESTAFVLGHNLIAFDLPHLAAARPDLKLLKLPAIDTLRLNPLAFPRNPYHRLLEHLAEQPAVLVREDRGMPEVPPELGRRYSPLGPKDVDLGYAGRHQPNASVHRAIAALSPGDEVGLRQTAHGWELCDRHGQVVGRLAKASAPPAGMRFLSGQVRAVIVRRREDSEPEYQAALRCDQWEVVLPELVFEPEA